MPTAAPSADDQSPSRAASQMSADHTTAGRGATGLKERKPKPSLGAMALIENPEQNRWCSKTQIAKKINLRECVGKRPRPRGPEKLCTNP